MTMTTKTIDAPSEKDSTFQLQASVTDRLADLPWWALFILLAAVFLVYNFSTNATYNEILLELSKGLGLTVLVTLSAYSIAIVLGLLTALGQLAAPQLSFAVTPGQYIKAILLVFFRNIATLYVQIIRGVPIIVQIFYVALVIIPTFGIPAINWLGMQLGAMGVLSDENALAMLTNRQVNFTIRGIVALALAYGAFSSEIFRAGIQAIEKGQIEAAKALGLSWFQVFRLIIFPQALRTIMPPLGNDFIAMLKESSLVSVVGVDEITLLGRKYASTTFLFPQTYNTLGFLYLSMTLLLSIGVKYIERRFKTD